MYRSTLPIDQCEPIPNCSVNFSKVKTAVREHVYTHDYVGSTQACQIVEGEIAKEAARNASLQLLIHLIRDVTFLNRFEKLKLSMRFSMSSIATLLFLTNLIRGVTPF